MEAKLFSKKGNKLCLYNLLLKIVHFFYPNYCANCEVLLKENEPNCFCKNCWGKIKIITESCKKCGKPVITGDGLCNDCKKTKKFYYEKIKVLGLYEGVLKKAIHLYKFLTPASLV